MVDRKDSTQYGLIRLYDIEPASFTWDSWILDKKKPRKVALESFLIYTVGFDGLDYDRAVFDVRVDNTHTLKFHRRFEACENGSDELNINFDYSCERFEAHREANIRTVLTEAPQ